VKNNSGISDEHKVSPENESLSPYIDGLSPGSEELSPEETKDLSTRSINSAVTEHTEDNFIVVDFCLSCIPCCSNKNGLIK